MDRMLECLKVVVFMIGIFMAWLLAGLLAEHWHN